AEPPNARAPLNHRHEVVRLGPLHRAAQIEFLRRQHHAFLGNPQSPRAVRSEEHTSELQSPCNLVCRLLLEKKKSNKVSQCCSPQRRSLGIATTAFLLEFAFGVLLSSRQTEIWSKMNSLRTQIIERVRATLR